MSTFFALVLALASLAPAPAPGTTASAVEPARAELERLQGTWAGTAGPKKTIAVTMDIRGADVSVEVKPPVGPPIRANGRIRLDLTASPKALDWVRFTAQDGQPLPEILGIYEFDGDAFRICTGGPHNPRPTEFERGEGILADVVVFRRPPATVR